MELEREVFQGKLEDVEHKIEEMSVEVAHKADVSRTMELKAQIVEITGWIERVES